MGSVSSASASPTPDSDGSVAFQFFGSSVVRASSSGTGDAEEDVDCCLQILEQGSIEFSLVQIYRQPFSAGVADHHLMVYWYSSSGVRGVQIDWGQNGLAFNDCSRAPDGAVVRTKECGLSPNTLAGQVRNVRSRCYSLVQWNCQHFCQHLFERAGGNSRLNEELDRLSRLNIMFDSATIYQETPGSVGDWLLVYWYKEGQDGNRSGLQLQWGPSGLEVEAVSGEPGVVVRSRSCKLEPRRLRRMLRETEGWPFDVAKWNRQQLAEYFFDRVLANGGAARLREHLDELAVRGAEIAGVLDVTVGDSTDHALVYKYRASGDRVVHLRVDFGEQGLMFTESEELPPSVKTVRTKPMLFVRLQPGDFGRQVLEIEGRPYNAKEWNSQHFVNHLFEQVPGKSRAAKEDVQAPGRPKVKEKQKPSKPARI